MVQPEQPRSALPSRPGIGGRYRLSSRPGVCRVCGCTNQHACWDPVTERPCHWVEPDLCSVCAAIAAETGR